MKIKLELTEEEQKTLLALIDIAVKAEGLRVAQPAVNLAMKIKSAPTGE
jgi:hypothetical protein